MSVFGSIHVCAFEYLLVQVIRSIHECVYMYCMSAHGVLYSPPGWIYCMCVYDFDHGRRCGRKLRGWRREGQPSKPTHHLNPTEQSERGQAEASDSEGQWDKSSRGEEGLDGWLVGCQCPPFLPSRWVRIDWEKDRSKDKDREGCVFCGEDVYNRDRGFDWGHH